MSKNQILSDLYKSNTLKKKLRFYTKDPDKLDDLLSETFVVLCAKDTSTIIESSNSGKLLAFAVSIAKCIWLTHINRDIKTEFLPDSFDVSEENNHDQDMNEDKFDNKLESINHASYSFNFYEREVFEGWKENDYNLLKFTEKQHKSLVAVNKSVLYKLNKKTIAEIKRKARDLFLTSN